MLTIPFIDKYVTRLSSPRNNLAGFSLPWDGTIRAARVRGVNAHGETNFNFQLDGVYQFAPTISGSLILSTVIHSAEFDGLAIAAAKDSTIRWDAVKVASLANGPFFFELDIESAANIGRRETANKTTASLANAATESSTVPLGKFVMLRKVTADRSCRVRLYLSTAHRTADLARPIGTDPEGEAGVLMDLYLTPGNLVWEMAQALPIYDPLGVGDIVAAVTNLSGSTSTVDLDFDFNITEE